MEATEATLEEVKEAMCDKYCKYPFEIADEEALRIVCNRCPLNRLEPDYVAREERKRDEAKTKP